MWKSRAFRALANRDYRLFYAGQGVSLVGTWLQSVALSWLAWRLTGSPLVLGVLGFAQHAGVMLLAPFSGVLADRIDRHRGVVVTQALQLVLAATLAALTLAGAVSAIHLVAVALANGIIIAFDVPLRQTLTAELVGDRDVLPNAIALNSMLFNVARVAGPALAGLLLAIVGEGWCFAINAATFLAVLVAMHAMRWRPSPRARQAASAWRSWLEGVRYVRGNVPIRTGLVMVAAVSSAISPYVTLMPIFAAEVYGGGPTTLGTLLASAGSGALLGAAYLATRADTRGLDLVVVRAGMLSGFALLAFGACRSLPLALALLAMTGFGFVAATASLNTLIQTLVDDDKRGRVMSLYAFAFIGTTPLGNLAAGSIASVIGAPALLAINGVLCAIAFAWLRLQLPRLRALARPAYVRAGIIRGAPR